ncbi:MAG: glutamate racemase [Bacteroidales bacterium]|nr:glutamate racemase [Bacteroidales bacterium]
MIDQNLKIFTVGIFDSGVGGLSVWKEIIKIMPNNNYIYFSDSAYCPYGPRPQSEIIDRARAITKFLIGKGADIIVVACNTATAAAIKTLREEFSLPFIGMEPAVKPAALCSKTGVIGVLATKGTLSGSLYNQTLKTYANGIEVIEKEGKGLVALVEEGKLNGEETDQLLRKYITPMLEKGADQIVLGCTHYPFLLEAIKQITGNSVKIIDPAPAVAKHLYDVLEQMQEEKLDYEPLKPTETTMFYTTGNIETLMGMARRIVPGIEDEKFNAADF